MRSTVFHIAVATVLLAPILGLSLARAQHQSMQHMQQHQQMPMQHQMMGTNPMMQRMTDMMGESHHLSQMLGHMMDQQHGSMRNQLHTMQQMSESMGTMAENMKSNLVWCNQVMQDQDMMKSHGMQKQMERFRGDMGNMAGQMEDAIQSLEKATKRIGDGQPNK